jgi:hypothetical protein
VIAWIAEADRRSSGKTPPTPAPRINSPKGRFGCRMRRAAEVGPAEQFTNHQVIRKGAFDQGRATAITSVTCLAPRNAWILIGPSGQLRTEFPDLRPPKGPGGQDLPSAGGGHQNKSGYGTLTPSKRNLTPNPLVERVIFGAAETCAGCRDLPRLTRDELGYALYRAVSDVKADLPRAEATVSHFKRKRCAATLGSWRRFRRAIAAPSARASIHRCASEASRSPGASANR